MSNTIRDTILNAEDIPSELMTEWGVEFEVRGMTAGAASDFLAAVTDEKGNMDRAAWGPGLLIACLYQPGTDEKVFGRADAEALARKSAATSVKVAGRAAILSGIMGEDEVVEDFE